MQIFLPYVEPFNVAKVLDHSRLQKQILECDWLIDGVLKNTRAIYHPITKMYKGNLDFIEHYQNCLRLYINGNLPDSLAESCNALECLPDFLKDADWYFDNFKKRLYTKDPVYYAGFSKWGQSYSNYYFIEGVWKEYQQQ
jgi:hypothetical protein